MTLGLSMRRPPANVEAEQALLGAILANNRAYERVSGFLRAEHFADPVYGRIYADVAQIIDRGRLVDVLTLRAYYENAGVLDEVGGVGHLTQLLTAMVGIINAGEYGRAIHDAWWRRQLIEIGSQLVNAAFGDGSGRDAKDVHEAAESALFGLAESGETGEAVSQAYEAMTLAIDAAEKARDAPGGLVGMSTGLRELDDLTGGWRRGSFNLLAARPSMGKTQLGLKIATAAALNRCRVLFVSLEMTRQQLGASMAAGLGRVPRDVAERGKARVRDVSGRFNWQPMTDGDVTAMVQARHMMVDRYMLIDECRARTMSAVRQRARREKRRGGLDLVVIDYIGLLHVPDLRASDNRVLEMTRLSAECKALARELDVPMVVLAQLNRASEARDNKRPQLSDLRDSGALEQDADLVLFPYREEYHLSREVITRKPGEDEEKFHNRASAHQDALAAARGKAELIVAKNRLGAIGMRVVGWDAEQTWFHDLEGE